MEWVSRQLLDSVPRATAVAALEGVESGLAGLNRRTSRLFRLAGSTVGALRASLDPDLPAWSEQAPSGDIDAGGIKMTRLSEVLEGDLGRAALRGAQRSDHDPTR